MSFIHNKRDLLRASPEEIALINAGLMDPKMVQAGPGIRAHTQDSGAAAANNPMVGITLDAMTIDGSGQFLLAELERLDPTMHDPLVAVTWQRDIDLRTDVTIADEQSSYTNSSFASPGGMVPSGKAWITKNSNTVTGIQLDIGKTIHPLYLWAMEIKYSIIELIQAQRLGRPVDVEKYRGLRLKWNMDTDEQVYIGDAVLGVPGLVNNTAQVATTNVVNGASGSPSWANKSPAEILADVNAVLNSVWMSSGFAVMPRKLLLPPISYSYLISQTVSGAGTQSIMRFLQENSLSNAANGIPLEIQPVKWLNGRGVGGTNRMVAYTQDHDRIRFPMVPLQRTILEQRQLYQETTYYGRLGVMEFVYPETIGYCDGF